MGSKWTLSEPEQRQMNEEIKNLDIFSVPTTSLYHYTSREVFWKIIEGESLWRGISSFPMTPRKTGLGRKKWKKL